MQEWSVMVKEKWAFEKNYIIERKKTKQSTNMNNSNCIPSYSKISKNSCTEAIIKKVSSRELDFDQLACMAGIGML